MSAPGPAFGQAVVHHREAASHLAAAYRLTSTHAADQAQLATLQQVASQLSAQSAALTQLASQHHIAAPSLDDVAPSPVADFGEAIGRARDNASHAEASLLAAQKEFLPAVLPNASPIARTLVVYGGWSVLAWFAQFALLLATGGTDATALVASLCGMPLFAFAAGFVTLQAWGQPRTGPRIKHPVRLGALICFLAMPLAWVVLVIFLSIL